MLSRQISIRLTVTKTRKPALRGRGTLDLGSFADVVLLDPKAEWTFRAAASKSKPRNTPFDGFPMLGKVQTTISERRVVYRPE